MTHLGLYRDRDDHEATLLCTDDRWRRFDPPYDAIAELLNAHEDGDHHVDADALELNTGGGGGPDAAIVRANRAIGFDVEPPWVTYAKPL